MYLIMLVYTLLYCYLYCLLIFWYLTFINYKQFSTIIVGRYTVFKNMKKDYIVGIAAAVKWLSARLDLVSLKNPRTSKGGLQKRRNRKRKRKRTTKSPDSGSSLAWGPKKRSCLLTFTCNPPATVRETGRLPAASPGAFVLIRALAHLCAPPFRLHPRAPPASFSQVFYSRCRVHPPRPSICLPTRKDPFPVSVVVSECLNVWKIPIGSSCYLTPGPVDQRCCKHRLQPRNDAAVDSGIWQLYSPRNFAWRLPTLDYAPNYIIGTDHRVIKERFTFFPPTYFFFLSSFTDDVLPTRKPLSKTITLHQIIRMYISR